ncbi:UNVERIFIED_CONTAM: hypothetical protein Slati_1429100 [Sesamum latifolium]|uniref:DUF4283 domain-containing protein n=1 Tax=Sesamum latifolium TaxID=2727402 RepID=A0AAW2X7H7_9LAMI
MRVFKWTPAFNPREESLIVSIWVRLLELPIQFFDKEALFSIGHLLGTPLRTDVSMATLVRPSVAWVCVEINLLELLQTEVGLGFGTEMFIQPCFMSGFQSIVGLVDIWDMVRRSAMKSTRRSQFDQWMVRGICSCSGS